ncbi:MAG: hypothetical protein R3B96_24820 [Pirellulaceae bacterium]
MTGQQSVADRLKDVRVEARGDLDISRHVFMEEPAYILRDPVSFQSHRFSVEDYRILSALRGDHTLSEVFQTLVASGELGGDDEELFYEFVLSLQRLGLLTAPYTDGGSLYKRHMSKLRAKQKSLPMQLLSFKVSLVNPDRFLKRAMPYVRFLFSRTFFAFWLVMVGIAASIVGIARRVLRFTRASWRRAISHSLGDSRLPQSAARVWTRLRLQVLRRTRPRHGRVVHDGNSVRLRRCELELEFLAAMASSRRRARRYVL